MREHAPNPQGRPPRAEYRHSPLLQFGREIHLPGDPDTAEDISRALDYLEAITALATYHFVGERKVEGCSQVPDTM